MRYLTIAATTVGIIASSTTASVSQAAVPSSYHWRVHNRDAGCTGSGCTYDFNVTGPLESPYPEFKAYCSGSDTGHFKECEILSAETTSGAPSIYGKLQQKQDPNFPDGIARMSMRLAFTDVETDYTYSGYRNATYNQFAARPENFDIKPTQAMAVG